VLTYSNWETGSICFSESFESLSEGLQNALWELGGVPEDDVVGFEFGDDVGLGIVVEVEIGCLGILRNYN
jgi:hypothetical protein